MAKSKLSVSTREQKQPPETRRKQRRSVPQSPTAQKSRPPIHYEIDTEYGRLVCDYDESTALATDDQGDEVVAIVKAIRDRFEEDFTTIPNRPEFALWIEAHARKAGITNEQAEQVLKRVLISSHTSSALFEFTSGLPTAIRNAMSQQFEMSIMVAKIQRGGLEPKLGVVADRIIRLVKQQIEQRIKLPHIGGGPLANLAWHYFICLEDWQEAKRIYRRNRNSTSWRKTIKDELHDLSGENRDLPDDLIEWLGISEEKDKNIIGADAFPNLSDDARHRLDRRMRGEGYWLSMPTEIALEHAARLCGVPPYTYSTYRLKNIKAEHAEEAERFGVRYYIKNIRSRRSHQSNTTKD